MPLTSEQVLTICLTIIGHFITFLTTVQEVLRSFQTVEYPDIPSRPASPTTLGTATPSTTVQGSRCEHCSAPTEDTLTNHCLAHFTRAERTFRGLSEHQWRTNIAHRQRRQ